MSSGLLRKKRMQRAVGSAWRFSREIILYAATNETLPRSVFREHTTHSWPCTIWDARGIDNEAFLGRQVSAEFTKLPAIARQHADDFDNSGTLGEWRI
jgi:hypothetical protein